MKAQYKNKLLSSFTLWFNHQLLSEGEAFKNHGSYFYPTNQIFNGFHTYACPFNQLVSDSSISGAQVPTGLYVNNVFVTSGVSGFHGIDYERGRAYFTSPLPSTAKVSGNYAYKEVNVVLSNEPEEKLLFETKYSPRSPIGKTPTGLFSNELTYPVVFIKYFKNTNTPFALGGDDNSTSQISAIVLADSDFTLDAITSIFEDKARTIVPLFSPNEYPYNYYGELRSGFNYTAASENKDYAFIDDSSSTYFSPNFQNRIREVNPNLFLGVIDFVVTKVRAPRTD
jgi:hypothetical protein